MPFLTVNINIFGYGNNMYNISKRSVISVIIAFITFLIGILLSNSWIYYNILCVCISVGAIKMFRFRSLRNATYTLLTVVITTILITICSSYALPRAVNDYASELSSPIVL